MELTRANLDRLLAGYKTILNQSLARADKSYEAWCTVTGSSAPLEQYPVTVFSGRMQEWVGDLQYNGASGLKMDVYNKDYADGVEVCRNDILWDKIGQYQALFAEMGINAANLWPLLATRALTSNGIWADGVAFFGTHKFGKNKIVIDNKITGALSTPNYEAARARMGSFRSASGDPLGLVADTLMVGPSNETLGRRILEMEMTAETVGDATVAVSNVNKGTARLLVNPFLVGDEAGFWCLMCTTRGVRPVVVQKAKEGALIARDQENDGCVFEQNKNQYKIHYIGASACGAPQVAVAGGLA